MCTFQSVRRSQLTLICFNKRKLLWILSLDRFVTLSNMIRQYWSKQLKNRVVPPGSPLFWSEKSQWHNLAHKTWWIVHFFFHCKVDKQRNCKIHKVWAGPELLTKIDWGKQYKLGECSAGISPKKIFPRKIIRKSRLWPLRPYSLPSKSWRMNNS